MEEEKKAEVDQTQPAQSIQPVSQPNSPDPKPQVIASSSKKTNKKTLVFIIIAIVLVIAILLVLFIKPKTNTETIEKYNVSYSIYSQNVLADSGNSLFTKGTISKTLGLSSDKLDTEVNAMSTGQEKNITLNASEAYGEYDPELVFTYDRIEKINRTTEMNRTAWITVEQFTSSFGEQPELDKEYNLTGAPWPYKVVELNTTDVKLSQQAILNTEVPYGIFTLKVIEVTADKIKLKYFGNNTVIPSDNGNYTVDFTDNEIITTFTPEIGQEIELTGYPIAKVIAMDETTITLDGNNELAGKTITIQVKLVDKKLERVKTTGSAIKHIEGAPVMQVFIMSHCPYGTQIVKGLLPVWKAFINKANIELRFVSYTMHGEQEELDNKRITCIREEQSSKLLDYLECFVYGSGDEASSQSCISSVGIDKAKLDSCVANSADAYLEEDAALNEEYGVQGSPTVILDGKEAQVYPRDPQSVANALCDAFTTKPSECSQSFSTENPSAGFGGGSGSSSGSGGSCG